MEMEDLRSMDGDSIFSFLQIRIRNTAMKGERFVMNHVLP